MANENFIGHGACPICGSVKARYTFSKKSLACITCNACQFQGFARSDNSDTRLRALVRAPVEPVAAPAATVAAPAAPVAAKPAPAPAAEKPFSWGFMGALNGS